jgi:hypothetical protein
MTQLTENLTVWELWYFKAVTSYRGERFQVPTRRTTVTRQTGEYKVDLTCHRPRLEPTTYHANYYTTDAENLTQLSISSVIVTIY